MAFRLRSILTAACAAACLPAAARADEPTASGIAAAFTAWEGAWSGQGQAMNFETMTMVAVSDAVRVRRDGFNAVALEWSGDNPVTLNLRYDDGALVFNSGSEREAREEIIDFVAPGMSGDWRIVTAHQEGEEDELFDVLRVYHMREGRFMSEIAASPAGEDDFVIEWQVGYARAD